MERQIKCNAELVIRQVRDLLGIVLFYDEKSVAWLDNYIVNIRADLSQEVTDDLVSVLGSFFGECIRYCYGGDWKQTEGQWAVVFDDGNAVFPFTKMSKHFEREGESILALYTSIPLVFKDVLRGESSSVDPSANDQGVDTRESDKIASLLESLRSHDYWSRKYRCNGDAYYEIGNDRFSIEYHNLAVEEERNAKEILTKLEAELGPAGSIIVPGPEQMEQIRRQAEALPNPWTEEDSDFDDACFYARYPRWTQFMPRLWRAYEKWKDDPRFLQEAPGFRPVNPTWKP